MSVKGKIDIEKAMKRLEEIVQKLENETLPLDECMKLFEEGQGLIKQVEKEFKDAEERIAKLEN